MGFAALWARHPEISSSVGGKTMLIDPRVSDRPPSYGRRVNPMLTPQFRLGERPPNFGKKYPPEVYTDDEVLRVMAKCGRGPGGYRNRAMIAVMWRSGLRVAEACALEPKDVDFELGAIRVLHGKGDQHRVVHLDPQTAALIVLWMQRRDKLRLGRGYPLFCTYERGIAGQPLRTAYVRQALKRAGRAAGIEKRVNPHSLRHTCLFNMRRAKVDILYIQETAGHHDLGTTQRYLNHHAPIDRLAALAELPWPDVPASLVASVGRLPSAG